MRKALVIGGSGFFGRHIISALLDKGIEVVAVEHHRPVQAGPGIQIRKGGLGSVNHKWLGQFKPDVIFHAARPRFPSLRKPGRALAALYAARLNRQLIRQTGLSTHKPHLVFASGSLMYGPSSAPVDESAPLKPFSFARQYYRGEIPILKAMEARTVPVSVVRLPWLLGNGSWFGWFYLKIMEKHRAVPLFGKGENLMEILDATDAARLVVRIAADHENTGIFNVVSAGAIPQKAFATTVAKISGLPVIDYRDIFTGGMEKEALEAFTCSITLKTKHTDILKDFHFTPLEESVRRIISDYGRLR